MMVGDGYGFQKLSSRDGDGDSDGDLIKDPSCVQEDAPYASLCDVDVVERHQDCLNIHMLTAQCTFKTANISPLTCFMVGQRRVCLTSCRGRIFPKPSLCTLNELNSAAVIYGQDYKMMMVSRTSYLDQLVRDLSDYIPAFEICPAG